MKLEYNSVSRRLENKQKIPQGWKNSRPRYQWFQKFFKPLERIREDRKRDRDKREKIWRVCFTSKSSSFSLLIGCYHAKEFHKKVLFIMMQVVIGKIKKICPTSIIVHCLKTDNQFFNFVQFITNRYLSKVDTVLKRFLQKFFRTCFGPRS